MESINNQSATCVDCCMVCLCSMNDLAHIVTTNCGHIFHTKCISTWYDTINQLIHSTALRVDSH